MSDGEEPLVGSVPRNSPVREVWRASPSVEFPLPTAGSGENHQIQRAYTNKHLTTKETDPNAVVQ